MNAVIRALHHLFRFDVFIYALNPGDDSTYRQEIEKASSNFRDLSGWPTQKVVEKIVEDEVQICSYTLSS